MADFTSYLGLNSFGSANSMQRNTYCAYCDTYNGHYQTCHFHVYGTQTGQAIGITRSKLCCSICGISGCNKIHEIKNTAKPASVTLTEMYKGKPVIKENKTMYSSMKEFVSKHSDLIWTLVLALMLDKFVFEGKFKSKLVGMLETVVDKASAKVSSLS